MKLTNQVQVNNAMEAYTNLCEKIINNTSEPRRLMGYINSGDLFKEVGMLEKLHRSLGYSAKKHNHLIFKLKKNDSEIKDAALQAGNTEEPGKDKPASIVKETNRLHVFLRRCGVLSFSERVGYAFKAISMGR